MMCFDCHSLRSGLILNDMEQSSSKSSASVLVRATPSFVRLI